MVSSFLPVPSNCSSGMCSCVQSRDMTARNHRCRIVFHQPYHLGVAKIPVTAGKQKCFFWWSEPYSASLFPLTVFKQDPKYHTLMQRPSYVVPLPALPTPWSIQKEVLDNIGLGGPIKPQDTVWGPWRCWKNGNGSEDWKKTSVFQYHLGSDINTSQSLSTAMNDMLQWLQKLIS